MPMVDVAIEQMLNDVASIMTPRLQQFARQAGWPRDTASELSLGVDKGHLIPQYDEDSGVEDLEYGTVGRAPKSAIGNFFSSHTIKREMERVTHESMGPLIEHVDRLFA